MTRDKRSFSARSAAFTSRTYSAFVSSLSSERKRAFWIFSFRSRSSFKPQKARNPLTAASLLLTLAGAYWPIKASFHSSSKPLVMASPARKAEREVKSWTYFSIVATARSCSRKYKAYFWISAGVMVNSCFFMVVSSLSGDTIIVSTPPTAIRRKISGSFDNSSSNL